MSPHDPKSYRLDPISGLSSNGGDAQRQPVLGPLRDLLTDLSRVRRGDPPSSWTDEPFTIWQDDDYIYLDAILSGLDLSNVDISIYDGKLLIRMGR